MSKAIRTRIYSAPVVAVGPSELPSGQPCTVYKIGAREIIAVDWVDWELNCMGEGGPFEYSLASLPPRILLDLDVKTYRKAKVFGRFDTPELFEPMTVVWEGKEEMNQAQFDTMLLEELSDMEAEGQLVPYLMSYGDLIVQLGELLNNKIISRWREEA